MFAYSTALKLAGKQINYYACMQTVPQYLQKVIIWCSSTLYTMILIHRVLRLFSLVPCNCMQFWSTPTKRAGKNLLLRVDLILLWLICSKMGIFIWWIKTAGQCHFLHVWKCRTLNEKCPNPSITHSDQSQCIVKVWPLKYCDLCQSSVQRMSFLCNLSRWQIGFDRTGQSIWNKDNIWGC